MDEFAHSLVPVGIEDELRSSYMAYSMSVIVGRALPDVRDGLKPVHRRILYAMFREGLVASRRYSKCAGVVGEVLKKYHPHGDSAVYDALVRMAQPWNLRYLLVDGQGNFGSVDGDRAAAYRYTESRMTRLAEELLADIDKDTVGFVPNFDGSTEEPSVLPAAFPNLLVNGSDGIAVGMATKIPPHNLAEIIDAVVAVIDNPAVSTADLMGIVPGPDFPTAGTIYGRMGIHDAYNTGRGKLRVRGNAFFEEIRDGRDAIIIDELPYQVNKARLVEEIADLVKDKRIDGISALRDESDRQGMRVVIELKRDAVRDIVLNQLYKHTTLQVTYSIILLAIVGNRPEVLTLKQCLEHYLSHRRDVTVRRCRYELRQAKDRIHILEGYLKALDHLDEIIKLIRASKTPDDARVGLVATFAFSEIQAQAILDMRLQRLTGMERQKIEEEYKEVLARIEWLESILADAHKLMALVRSELLEIKQKYGDMRRTRIVEDQGEVSLKDLIVDEQQAVTLSMKGYVKRTSVALYQEQKRGGFGKRAVATRDEDSISEIIVASSHAELLVFTTRGHVYKLKFWEVPEAGREARGTPIINLVPLEQDDRIAAVIPLAPTDDTADEENQLNELDLLFCSKRGLVKRTRLSEFRNLRSSGLRAYDCAEGDELFRVVLAKTDQHVFVATRQGKAIRFPGVNENGELEVRHMGRVARGVRGITLLEEDEICGFQVLEHDPSLLLLTVTENGYGKRTPLEEYRVQGRGGQGIINIVTDERNGRVVGSVQVHADDKIMLITDTGRAIKFRVADVRESGRNTKGVTLMRVEDQERVVSVARIIDDESDEGESGPPVDGETPAIEPDGSATTPPADGEE